MNSINWPASSIWVFITQLGEHCSANAAATGSNPVEAPKNFFSGYFRYCLNCDSLRWSHTHFICIPAVHIISFIKNLLEYNRSYTKSIGTNEFYYPDTSRQPDSSKFTTREVTHRQNAAGTANDPGQMIDAINPNYNKGFAARKVLLGASATVNCEIPLNRYSFFEELQDRLLPNVRIELQIEMENDKNLIWRTGAADAAGTSYRLIVTRLQLFVPKMIFNAEGQKLYLENYLKPHKWTYLTETTYSQNMGQERTGNFRLTNGIPKPRHVFVFFYQ